MTLILAADTSTDVNTIALCDCEEGASAAIRAESVVQCARRHAERIIETVNWVLAQGEAALEEVGLLAISTGPGSFTGLRIGVATWKGLAYAAGKPLLGVSTLDALARAAGRHDGLVCPMIDAKMGEVFGAVHHYDAGRRETLVPEQAATVEDVLATVKGSVYFIGDGAARYRERIQAVLPEAVFAPSWASVPRASAVAAEAANLAASGADTDAAAVSPVYLRKPKVDMRGVPAPPPVEAQAQ